MTAMNKEDRPQEGQGLVMTVWGIIAGVSNAKHPIALHADEPKSSEYTIQSAAYQSCMRSCSSFVAMSASGYCSMPDTGAQAVMQQQRIAW